MPRKVSSSSSGSHHHPEASTGGSGSARQSKRGQQLDGLPPRASQEEVQHHELMAQQAGRNPELKFVRQNHHGTWYSAPAAQEGRKEMREAQYAYRAMGKDEFDHLRETGKLSSPGYGGLATNREYSRKFITNNSPDSDVVEFDSGQPGGIYDRLKATEGPFVQPKAEGNGGTFGVGPSGGSQGRYGEAFNDMLDKGMPWKSVDHYRRHGQ